MYDNYIEFSSKLTKSQRLVSKAEILIKEMNDLQKRIDDQVDLQMYNNKQLNVRGCKRKLYIYFFFRSK